ncbi:MAG: hypothetical protein U9N59_00760 [Campylobacterota bacterium]|nr:hypothetical protein [Campylobacterota bacterium]
MKIKIFILLLSLNTLVNAVQVVPVTNKIINYKSKIYSSSVRLIQVNDKYSCKEYIDIKLLKQNKYYAKHYLAKNKPLCKKSVFLAVSKRIKFKFGNLEIEKDGEIIRETDQYIKIKTIDGKIEKIYKDGR